MATTTQWIAGARPRTLSAATVPVVIGTGVAVAEGHPVWWRAVLALVVSLALQIGCNYANDYSDGIRGTDDGRVGPMRLVGSGVAPPRTVKLAAFACFGLAAVAGLVLVAVTNWWLLLIGVAAIAAAWFYTGGSSPYGYRALGEVSVFVFFGLVAVVGTAYVQTGHLTWLAIASCVPIGLLIVALLVVNNLRDIPTDTASGKRTLGVVLGEPRTRAMYIGCLLLPFVIVLAMALARPWLLVALVALPLALPSVRTVRSGATGPALIPALGATGKLQIAFGVLFTIGLVA
ncbi:MAG TPA: 1,4-dihydroxy-2-naphthoate polyprenyltransferase [Streptosporangiaceae bacterium]